MDMHFSVLAKGSVGRTVMANRIGEKFKRAFALLKEASGYAQQTSGDIWEFALEIQLLRKLGLSENDLRFLVRLNLVDHASELKDVCANGRKFRATGDLHFTNRTCFVLTAAGISVVTSFSDAPIEPKTILQTVDRKIARTRRTDSETPHWDFERQVLLFRDQVIKRFKWHAANQEAILSAFQEEGWPARIDDPLVPLPAIDSKRRLSDAIKCLNRKRLNPVIRFRGDGTGLGAVWEACIPELAVITKESAESSVAVAR
jgi:hypothetical protein